jgi:uncharacterized protein (DUF4415 family)
MNKVPDSVRRELAGLAGKSDEDVDFSDIPSTAPADWANAERRRFDRPIKKQLTVRIDADILEWLKCDGQVGYQKRPNAVLRQAMLQTRSDPLTKT